MVHAALWYGDGHLFLFLAAGDGFIVVCAGQRVVVGNEWLCLAKARLFRRRWDQPQMELYPYRDLLRGSPEPPQQFMVCAQFGGPFRRNWNSLKPRPYRLSGAQKRHRVAIVERAEINKRKSGNSGEITNH